MDLFEQGRLKRQKINLSTLISKPQFKQKYLTPLRTLSQTEQLHILQEVRDMEVTTLDIKKLAGEVKSINGLNCFHETN